MLREENVPKELQLNVETVKEYLEQLDQWQEQELEAVRSRAGRLPRDWGTQMRSRLLARAKKEKPEITPLVKAQFGADPKEVPSNVHKIAVGKPITGENIIITGHISRSTLWLYDKDRDMLQTMVRLLEKDDQGSRLVDVYSDPTTPAIVSTEYGRTINVRGTEPTRARRILELAREHDAEIEGWVSIAEIDSKQIPSYEASSE